MAKTPKDDLQAGFDRLTRLYVTKQIDAATYRDEIRAHTGKSSARIDALEKRLKTAADRHAERHRPAPAPEQDDDQSQDQQQ